MYIRLLKWSVIPMNLFYMFDKEETKDEKETLWQEKLLNCVMN